MQCPSLGKKAMGSSAQVEDLMHSRGRDHSSSGEGEARGMRQM